MSTKSENTELKAHDNSEPEKFLVKTKPQEERFQRLISEIEDYAIILLDKEGSITTWNRGAEKIIGYAAAEIIGRNFEIFYSKEDRDSGLPAALLATAHDKNRVANEGWGVKKDGVRFWSSITITAVHNDAGEVSGYLKVTRDLTGRKIADDNYSKYVEELKQENEALKKSEDRYHKMVTEVTDYVIILLDREGHVLDWNKGAERIKGYKAQGIVGKSFRLFYTKEDKDAMLPEMLLKKAADGGSALHEGWWIRKDGTRFWGSVTITALHDDSGEIFGFSKVTRDLTERKIADDKLNNFADELKFKNEKLKESEERYQRMISEVQDYAIILLSPNGIIENWNAGAQYIKGYTADEIVGTSFERFYQPADRDAGLPQQLLAEAAEKGRVVHEGWRVRKDGSLFWGNVVITALHNDSNEIIGYSKVTRDLTSKKEAEDLIQSNAQELDRQNRSLQRLNEEVSSFAYVASHDLQEPLRKIRTFSSRIAEAQDLDTAKQLCAKVQNSAARMQALIQDLLAYSQISTEDTVFEAVDLNDIVKNVKDDLEIAMSERNCQVNAEDLCIVRGTKFQLQQLFSNLFSNALKFAKKDEPPVITVTCIKIHARDLPLGLVNEVTFYHKVSVSDNGIGFEEDEAKKIFKVFHRLHSHDYPGTGIGLAVVKRVMENLNGVVNAHGKPGIGATFDLYFPCF